MKLAKLAFGLALLAALLLLSAGPGTRLGLWEFGTGFLLMRVAFFAGVGAALFAVVLLLIPKTRAGSVGTLAAAVVVGLSAAWVPWNGLQTARSLPLIHDITTDTERPPAFVAILPLRAEAPNGAAYAGEEVAALQREAYPDVDTLELGTPAAATFERALATARDMGWEIVAAVPADGRIEATDTTFWFGFKDDVVIRIEAADAGSRIDVRSKSRVGRSDVGANAERIRAFVRELRARA